MTLDNLVDLQRRLRAPGAAVAVWRAEAAATLGLGLPLALSQLAVIALHATDTLMMGRLGVRELAAGGLANSVYMVLYLLAMGVVAAVAPLVAEAHGGGKPRTMRRIVRQGLWAGTAIGLPFLAILWYVRPILLTFGQDPETVAFSEDYMRALMWALPPALWIVAFRSFFAALHRPRVIVTINLAAVALNALGDYALMFGKFGLPALGLPGAGWTSFGVYLAMCGAYAVVLRYDRRARRFALLARLNRPDWAHFRQIFRIGLPIGGVILLEIGLFTGATFLMGLIGTTELAAHQIVLQTITVAYMVPLGIGQATTIRVARAVGAGDASGVGRAGWVALALMACFVVPVGLVMWLAPEAIVALYLDPDIPANVQVTLLASAYLLAAALFQVFDGVQVITLSALRGLKDTRMPMLIAGIGYWAVGFSAAVVLAFKFDLTGLGVWCGLAIGLAATAAMLSWRFAGRAGRLAAAARRAVSA